MKRYTEFDGLRGWLALWVAMAHMYCWCGVASIPGPGKLAALWKGFIAADTAVETFIILSGFAIHTLLLREPRPYFTYLTGRFFRIYPVYLLSLLSGVALMPSVIRLVPALPWSENYYLQWMYLINQAQSAHPAAHAFWHAILMHGIVPQSVLDYSSTTILKPAWSISLEWQFYIAAPFIAYLLRRSWGIVVLLAAAGLGLITRSYWENPDNAFLLRWLPMFLVGIASAEFAARCERDESLARRAGPALIAGGIGLAVFFVNRPASIALWVLVCTVSIGAWENFLPWAGAFCRRAMLLQPVQWLGEISYPLYLLHWPFIVGLLTLLHWLKPDLNPRDTLVLMLLSGLPLLLGMARVVHLFLEKPMMRMGRRITHRRAAPEPGPVPLPMQS